MDSFFRIIPAHIVQMVSLKNFKKIEWMNQHQDLEVLSQYPGIQKWYKKFASEYCSIICLSKKHDYI